MSYGYACAGCGVDLTSNPRRNTWCDYCHDKAQEESRRILALLPERNGLTAAHIDNWYAVQFARLQEADCTALCPPDALPSAIWPKWQEAVKLARTIVAQFPEVQ